MSLSKLISWTAVILWMVLIFSLSSQVAGYSNNLSTGLTKIIIETIGKFVHIYNLDIDVFNHFIRKAAHFSAYLMLGLLVINALRISGVKGVRGYAIALGVCSIYAISDEVHQLFVPGRSGQAMDVLIDSTGASVGAGIYLLTSKIVKAYNKGDINGNISGSTT